MHVNYLTPLPATSLPRNPEHCCGLLEVHFLTGPDSRTMTAGNDNPERKEIKDNLSETV